MSFLLPYVQQRSSKSSLSNPSPVEDMERASTPLSLETEEHARTACGSPAPPPTAPPPLVPTTSAERQRPSTVGPVAPGIPFPHQQRPSVPHGTQGGGHRAQTLESS
ncbi:hypothetical protein KUCAC02_028435 [Chaenocephalus aceratus]|uniref:Uncharacterized protein n=1 Tax=Chaenocephalus aceratus TaxID=36190 RepID=A0ACB9X304_CHAAC|nr:hypothetical protein KUCAC02_028435 [Chaenocephalus aceratus]